MDEIKNDDLAALAGEAAIADAAAQPTAVPDAQNPEAALVAPPVDRTIEAKMLVGILRPMIVMAFPCVKETPDEEWQGLEEPIGDLLNHYNVDVGEWIKSPWLKLGIAAMPIAVRGFSKWQEEEAKEKAKDGPPVPQVEPQVIAAAIEPRA